MAKDVRFVRKKCLMRLISALTVSRHSAQRHQRKAAAQKRQSRWKADTQAYQKHISKPKAENALPLVNKKARRKIFAAAVLVCTFLLCGILAVLTRKQIRTAALGEPETMAVLVTDENGKPSPMKTATMFTNMLKYRKRKRFFRKAFRQFYA